MTSIVANEGVGMFVKFLLTTDESLGFGGAIPSSTL